MVEPIHVDTYIFTRSCKCQKLTLIILYRRFQANPTAQNGFAHWLNGRARTFSYYSGAWSVHVSPHVRPSGRTVNSPRYIRFADNYSQELTYRLRTPKLTSEEPSPASLSLSLAITYLLDVPFPNTPRSASSPWIQWHWVVLCSISSAKVREKFKMTNLRCAHE